METPHHMDGPMWEAKWQGMTLLGATYLERSIQQDATVTPGPGSLSCGILLSSELYNVRDRLTTCEYTFIPLYF